MFGDNENAGLPDPSKIDSNEGLLDHLVKARSVIKAQGDNIEAQKRAIADLTKELQALQQQGAVQTQRAALGAKDSELAHRYIDDSGRLHLKSVTRKLKFAGRTVEIEQPGLLDDREALTDWHLDVQKAVTRKGMVQLFAKGNRATPRTDAELLHLFSRAPSNIRGALEKAITDSAGSGAEWIPEMTFPDVFMDQFRTPNRLAGLFGIVNMPAPSIKQPRLGYGARPYKRVAIASDDPSNYTASTPQSSEDTITVTDWAVRVVADEMDGEDMVIMMEQQLQQIVARAINDGYEDTMLNGDTAGTHQDAIASWNIRSRWGASGLGGTADHRRIFLGLRALAADRSATVDMGSSQTVAGLMGSLVGAMGERAASDLAIIVSPEVFYQKLMADSNVLTLEKLGPQATLLSGQLATVFNIPLIVSRWMGADLAATGLYTGSGALSGALAVDRSAFFHYQRRGLRVEMDREIINGAVHVVATLRRLFKTPTSSSEIPVYYGYNWLS